GIYVYEMYYGCTLTIEGNTIGAYHYDGYTFDGNDRYGVYIDYVDYGCTVTIKDNDITENSSEGPLMSPHQLSSAVTLSVVCWLFSP
ncbi:unnamed protein product, partial [marine sediment metagenome]